MLSRHSRIAGALAAFPLATLVTGPIEERKQ